MTINDSEAKLGTRLRDWAERSEREEMTALAKWRRRQMTTNDGRSPSDNEAHKREV